MSFKKLSKQKRNHLVLVALITLAAVAGLGFGLIRLQYTELGAIAAQTETARKKLAGMKKTILAGREVVNELNKASQRLTVLEADMGAGDLYSWGLDVFRRFRANYKVELPAINQPVVGDTALLPKFPYQQATFTVGGTGYYRDLGRFAADFENQFPHLRIVNLTLDPVSSLISAEKERLEFKMDVVVLVRPNQN